MISKILEPSFCTELCATGLEGSVGVYISQQDLVRVMSRVLHLSAPIADAQDQDLVQSFQEALSIEKRSTT